MRSADQVRRAERSVQERRHVPTGSCGQSKEIREFCQPDKQGEELLEQAITKLGLSARAYDRILKVARTIADLSGSGEIMPEHIAEAIQYRTLDRQLYLDV